MSKNMKVADPKSLSHAKKAGEMLPRRKNHKFKTQTEELAQISLNLVDKIEHLAPVTKEKSPLDDSFTYEEINKISTLEKNRTWNLNIRKLRPMCRTLPIFILNKSEFMSELVRLLKNQDCNHAKYLRVLKMSFLDLGAEVFGCLFQNDLLVSLLESLTSSNLQILKEAIYCLAHIFKNNQKSVVQYHRQLFQGLVKVSWEHKDPHVTRLLMEVLAYIIRKKSADKMQAKMMYSLLKVVWQVALAADEVDKLEENFQRLSDFLSKLLFETMRGFMNCLTQNFHQILKHYVLSFHQLMKSLDKSIAGKSLSFLSSGKDQKGLDPAERSEYALHSIGCCVKTSQSPGDAKAGHKTVLLLRLMTCLSQSIQGCASRFMVHEFSFRFKRVKKSESQKPFEYFLQQIKILQGSFKQDATLVSVLKEGLRLSLQNLFYFKNAFFLKNNSLLKKLLLSEVKLISLTPERENRSLAANSEDEISLSWKTSLNIRIMSAFLAYFSEAIPQHVVNYLAQSSLFDEILKEILLSKRTQKSFQCLAQILKQELRKETKGFKLPLFSNLELSSRIIKIIIDTVSSGSIDSSMDFLLHCLLFKNHHDNNKSLVSIEETRVEEIVSYISSSPAEKSRFGFDVPGEEKNLSSLFILSRFFESFPLFAIPAPIQEAFDQATTNLSFFSEQTDNLTFSSISKGFQFKIQKLALQQKLIRITKEGNPNFENEVRDSLCSCLSQLQDSELSDESLADVAELSFFCLSVQRRLGLKLPSSFRALFLDSASILLKNSQKQVREKGLFMLQKMDLQYLNQSLAGLKQTFKLFNSNSEEAAGITVEYFTRISEEESSYSTLTLLQLLQDIHLTESNIQNERKIEISLQKLELLVKTWQNLLTDLLTREAVSEAFKLGLTSMVDELMKIVYYFLEGFLWVPFETNKKSVLKCLGLLVNSNTAIFERLWSRIDEISESQFTKNAFHQSTVFGKGKKTSSLILSEVLKVNAPFASLYSAVADQFKQRSLTKEIFHSNLRKVLIGHRKIKSADEMQNLVQKLLEIVVKQRQHSVYQNILRDFRKLLKGKSLFFLSANLFVPGENTVAFLSEQLGTESECAPVWNFSHATLFQDFLKMAGTVAFHKADLVKETSSVWFESLQCLALILLTRLRSEQIVHVTQLLTKLFPSIFKGRKELLKGIFTTKTFRNFNETYDFCLEHESVLAKSLAHFVKGVHPAAVKGWNGKALTEVSSFEGQALSGHQVRAQQEGLDKNMQEQVDHLRHLDPADKLRLGEMWLRVSLKHLLSARQGFANKQRGLSMRKYILDRISWMPLQVRFFFLHLLFNHYNFDLLKFIQTSQNGEATAVLSMITGWLETLTVVPELFDFLEEILVKFGVRFLNFVSWVQTFLLQILEIISSKRDQVILENPGKAGSRNTLALIEKKCLSILNLACVKFPFMDCSALVSQLLEKYLRGRLRTIIDSNGIISKTMRQTLSICANQKLLKILFLEFPILVETLIHCVDQLSQQKLASTKEFLTILRTLLSVTEEDQDSDNRFETDVQIRTISNADCKIEIEQQETLTSQTKRIAHLISVNQIDNEISQVLLETVPESHRVEELIVLEFGQALLGLVNRLFAKIFAKVKGKMTIQKLFSSGCLVEVVSLLLEKQTSKYLNSPLSNLQLLPPQDSTQSKPSSSQTDQLLEVFFFPLSLTVLESQFSQSRIDNLLIRFSSLLHSVTVLLAQSTSPSRFLIKHLLPLLQGLSHEFLLFEIAQVFKSCADLPLVKPISASIEFLCDLFTPKNEFSQAFDYEKVFLKLEELYKGEMLQADQTANSEIILSSLVRFLRCSDASCRNLTLEIFTKYFENLSGNSIIQEATSSVLVYTLKEPHVWTPAQLKIQFIRRLLLKNLMQNLTLPVENAQQLQTTVSTLLVYSKFAAAYPRSSEENEVRTLFPYQDLACIATCLTPIFSIKSSERLSGVYKLLNLLKDPSSANLVKPITFKDLLIPLMERLCELQVRQIAEGRSFKGKSSQSRIDSVKNILSIIMQVISQMLHFISLNDFKAFLKRKMNLLKRKRSEGLFGLKLAMENEMKDYQASLLLATLGMITKSGLGEDIIEQVNLTMRVKLLKGQEESRILGRKERPPKTKLEAAKQEIKRELTTVQNEGDLKMIRELTQKSLQTEMAIAGDLTSLAPGTQPLENIGLDATQDQLHVSALVQAVDEFNENDEGFISQASNAKPKPRGNPDSLRFINDLLKHLLRAFFVKGQKAKRTRRERKLLKVKENKNLELREVFALGEGVVRVARLLPFQRFKFEFSKVVIRLCELLGHPDEKLRVRSRKSLASVAKTTGPFVFGIVVRELKENLKEGKLQFVRNYSLAFVLQEVFKASQDDASTYQCGDLDVYMENIVELALEEVEDFALENRDSQFTKGHKWKEMRSPKGGLLFQLMGKMVYMNGEAVLEVLMLLHQYITKAKGFRAAILKTEKMLSQFTIGLTENPSFSSAIAFVLAEAQMKLHASETPDNKLEIEKVSKVARAKRHDMKRTFEVQEGAAQGKAVKKSDSILQERSKVISRIFCEFALGLLEKALKKSGEALAQELTSQGVDFPSTYNSVCKLTNETKDLGVKSRCLSVILNMHSRGLISCLKTPLFEEVITNCLKDLDGSRPALVQKTFLLLPHLIGCAADLHPESKNDILFCIKEFLYLDDYTLAVAEFVQHCLVNDILCSELLSISDSLLEVFFETQNDQVSKVFEKVLLILFALPFVGPGLAKKLAFDLAKNLEKGSIGVQMKTPFLLLVLFQGQAIAECLGFLDMFILEIEVFRANVSSSSEGDPVALLGLLIHYLHLKLASEAQEAQVAPQMEAIFNELQSVCNTFPNYEPERKQLVCHGLYFLTKISGDAVEIRPEAVDRFSQFMNVSKVKVTAQPEITKKIQGVSLENGLSLSPASLKNFNLFGEKYFTDLFDKAEKLVKVDSDLKLKHVGLSLIVHLARASPKPILNRLCGGDAKKYFKDFDLETLEEETLEEIEQRKVINPSTCLLDSLMLSICKCVKGLPKLKNLHESTKDKEEEVEPEEPTENERSALSEETKLCLRFSDLLEVLLFQKSSNTKEFALLMMEKYFFDRTSLPLQLRLLNIMDKFVAEQGLAIMELPSLPRVLLFCFGLINQRNSEFQDNARLFRIISRLHLGAMLETESPVLAQIESVLLRNLRRGIRDIGRKKALIFKSQSVVLLILRQMNFLRALRKPAKTLLGKRPDSGPEVFHFSLSEPLSEIVFIVSENAEIEKVDRLREKSEEIAALAKVLWNPTEFESSQLQRRMQRSKKKADLKRKMEILAVTEPEKYAQIKVKLNERKKKNRSVRKKILGIYKHESAAKKLSEF